MSEFDVVFMGEEEELFDFEYSEDHKELKTRIAERESFDPLAVKVCDYGDDYFLSSTMDDSALLQKVKSLSRLYRDPKRYTEAMWIYELYMDWLSKKYNCPIDTLIYAYNNGHLEDNIYIPPKPKTRRRLDDIMKKMKAVTYFESKTDVKEWYDENWADTIELEDDEDFDSKVQPMNKEQYLDLLNTARLYEPSDTNHLGNLSNAFDNTFIDLDILARGLYDEYNTRKVNERNKYDVRGEFPYTRHVDIYRALIDKEYNEDVYGKDNTKDMNEILYINGRYVTMAEESEYKFLNAMRSVGWTNEQLSKMDIGKNETVAALLKDDDRRAKEIGRRRQMDNDLINFSMEGGYGSFEEFKLQVMGDIDREY